MRQFKSDRRLEKSRKRNLPAFLLRAGGGACKGETACATPGNAQNKEKYLKMFNCDFTNARGPSIFGACGHFFVKQILFVSLLPTANPYNGAYTACREDKS